MAVGVHQVEKILPVRLTKLTPEPIAGVPRENRGEKTGDTDNLITYYVFRYSGYSIPIRRSDIRIYGATKKAVIPEWFAYMGKDCSLESLQASCLLATLV